MRRRPFQKLEGEYLFETRRMAMEEKLAVGGRTAWVEDG